MLRPTALLGLVVLPKSSKGQALQPLALRYLPSSIIQRITESRLVVCHCFLACREQVTPCLHQSLHAANASCPRNAYETGPLCGEILCRSLAFSVSRCRKAALPTYFIDAHIAAADRLPIHRTSKEEKKKQILVQVYRGEAGAWQSSAPSTLGHGAQSPAPTHAFLNF